MALFALGRRSSSARLGPLRGFANIYFLIGVRNRLIVVVNWLWIHARDQRGARLITWGGEVAARLGFRLTKTLPRARRPVARRGGGVWN